MYGLESIAAKVARVLPNGEKNGLRKTYKGKIKDLGISGRFDVTPHDEVDGGLVAMMAVPPDEWHAQHVQGHEIAAGLSTEVLEKLPRAMTMSKGTIPKSQWDRSVLGDLDLADSRKRSAVSSPIKGSTTPGLQARLGQSQHSPSPQQQHRSVSSPDLSRPKRKVKQRSYGDTSFEGYGEGFVDDDILEAGYSTGEGEDAKRRKKVRACFLWAQCCHVCAMSIRLTCLAE
jgi:hypothetical protein